MEVISVYEWLENEVSNIKMKTIHCLGSCLEDDELSVLLKNYPYLPSSYVEFVSKFGSAKLYKMKSYYKIGVLCPPKKITFPDGEKLLMIGHFDDSRVFFKSAYMSSNSESAIFEDDEEYNLEKIADSFDEWIIKRCEDAEKFYIELEEERIKNNSESFNDKEFEIIEARKKIKWQKIGFSPDGDVRILVRNESNLTLPFLTIGFRGKNPAIEGRIWLPISHVMPGQEDIVEHSGYKKHVSGEENRDFYHLPDPTPEEKDRFWEFRDRSIS